MQEAPLGKYKILRKLGSGGMGVVYLGRQSGPAGFDRLVVIKRIRAELLSDAEAAPSLHHEARLTAQLSHPNIIQIYDLGEEDNEPYLVMEYLHGKTLLDLHNAERARHSLIPLQHVLGIGINICRGLHYAHTFIDEQGRAHQMVHRDIKPSNFLLLFSGHVKIIDFGIAKSQVAPTNTKSGEIKGTIQYMSPEQVLGKPVDIRTDIFSLGVLLHQLVTGHHPFVKNSAYSTYAAILENPVQPASHLRAELPDAMDLIIETCLAKDPGKRFTSAMELQQALETLREQTCGTRQSAPEELAQYMDALFPGDSPLSVAAIEASNSSTGEQQSNDLNTTLSTPVNRQFSSVGSDIKTAGFAPPPRPAENRSLTPLSIIDDVSGPVPRHWRRTVLWAVPLLALLIWFGSLLFTDSSPPAQTRDLSAASTTRDSATTRQAAASADEDSHPNRDAVGTQNQSDSRRPAHRLDQTLIKADHPDTRRVPPWRKNSPPPTKHNVSPASAPDTRVATSVLGRLTLGVRPATTVVMGNQQWRGGASTLPITAPSGQLMIGGTSGPFKVVVSYRVAEHELILHVDAHPWAILYAEGNRPGRTPRSGLRVAAATRQIELRNPDGREMILTLRFERKMP